MKSWLYTPKGLLALALVVSVAAVGSFVGCRIDYSDANQSKDFLDSGRTLSFFTAIQIDPRSEDSAGPQFVVAEDLNDDGYLDLVSAWNQSQPIQIHLQNRSASDSISFETVTLAGNIPAVSIAGLAVADFDRDGAQDIVVLLKDTLLAGATCLDSEVPTETPLSGLILIYLGPEDPDRVNQALAWEEVAVEPSRLQGLGDYNSGPEIGGFTGMAVGDIDLDGNLDILAAWNSSCGGDSETHDVVLFTNPGPASIRNGTWRGSIIPNGAPFGTAIRDVALGDIDLDGDLDIVATFPDSVSMNIRWYRNPTIDVPDDYHIAETGWQVGTVAQIATLADVVRLADLDMDGLLDVVVRSGEGRVIQWLKGPGGEATTQPVANIPWQVYTLAEFTERTPKAIAVGDLNSDGQMELIVSAAGGMAWFDSQAAPTLYDQWIENLIIDDEPTSTYSSSPATTDPNVSPDEIAGTTLINSIMVVDLDGDGANDLVATFDRSGLSGLTNDALVWFRSTR